jgi:O-antigen/teichoic acid export membrane protein
MVASAIWYRSEINSAALAFLTSRVTVLVITWHDQRQYFSSLVLTSPSNAVRRLKDAYSYAYDFGLQSLMGPIDSLVLNYFLGPIAIGTHQAGMRIFLGGGQIANVLGNVFIPKLSALQNDTAQFKVQAYRLQTAFLLSGAFFGLTIAVGATPIVHLLYGDQYNTLANLLPWFGMLFFIRFFAAAYGVLLTASGRQNQRAKFNIIHWMIILSSAWFLVPQMGNTGWIIALTIGNAVLAGIYCIAMRKTVLSSHLNTAIAVGGFLALTPFLKIN